MHISLRRTWDLDMGEPVNILEFAKNLIREHGLVPDKDISIEITGLRPGEKMHEELLLDRSEQGPHDLIFVESDQRLPDDFQQKLEHLLQSARDHDAEATRKALQQIVPTATLSGNNKPSRL